MVPSRVGGLLRGRNPSPLVTPSCAALCGFLSVLGFVWLMLYHRVALGQGFCTSFVLYSNKDLLGYFPLKLSSAELGEPKQRKQPKHHAPINLSAQCMLY